MQREALFNFLEFHPSVIQRTMIDERARRDVARYRQIVPPVLSTVLTFIIMPVADFAAAIRVADLGIPD